MRQYEQALKEINPMPHQAMNSAAQSMWGQAGLTGAGVSAINNAWMTGANHPTAPSPSRDTTKLFTVEKVDNGFILRSGKYSKICKDMDELKDQFVAVLVEQQLDK